MDVNNGHKTDEMLGTAAVAAELGVDNESVRRWIVKGLPHAGTVFQLPALRAGRQWKVRRSDLQKFLDLINGGHRAQTVVESKAQQNRAAWAQQQLDEALHGWKRRREAKKAETAARKAASKAKKTRKKAK